MDDKLIKNAFKDMKNGLPKIGKCPADEELACFVEGTMDEGKAHGIENHLVACSTCCDYVVSLKRVIDLPEGDMLPEVPDKQIRKVRTLVEKTEKKGSRFSDAVTDRLKQLAEDIKAFFNFDWMMQPIPVAVRSGVGALMVILIVSATYFYYQQTVPYNIQMEIIGKTSVITTRGVPEEETRVVKNGDTLYSNDYLRITFEVNHDAYAYVLLNDSAGALHQLYPDPTLALPRKLQGDTTYTIPPEQENWLQLDDRRGRETVFVLAAREPLKGLGEKLRSLQGSSNEEIVKTLEDKNTTVKILSFEHQ